MVRKKGMTIGEGTFFFDPTGSTIDVQYPWLIHIGCNCKFSGKFTIMTHDFSWSVIKASTGELLGCSGPVTIGNNVFIGYGCTLLKGTNIGDNSIIGAGSVVSGKIPNNEVWGGNPAHFICHLENYYLKRQSRQILEAYQLFVSYYTKTNCIPNESVFFEYVSLFTDFSNKEFSKKYINRLSLMNCYEKTMTFYSNKKPVFSSFKEMILQFQKAYKENPVNNQFTSLNVLN